MPSTTHDNGETDERALRRGLLDVMRRLDALRLNSGSAGNASTRLRDGLLITPSGVAPDDMTVTDLVHMRADGGWRCRRRGRTPSSEWRMHRDLLVARPEFGAIVHTHSPAATALACLRRGIPAFHYMVAVAGGDDIRCAPYVTFGTPALSEFVVEAMHGRRACVMANHGLLVAGRDLETALLLAVQVEGLADTYLRALAVGEPALLDAAQMAEVRQRFEAGYGSTKKPD